MAAHTHTRVIRYVVLVLGVIIVMHYMLSFIQDYRVRQVTSKLTSSVNDIDDGIYADAEDIPNQNNPTIPNNPTKRANATFVILARNSDLEGTIQSVRAIEDRFNVRYGYPYVFLNDVPFDDEFVRRISILTPSKVEFGVVPKEHWVQPEWIDEDRARRERERMGRVGVKYGGSVAYRNMCRFNSGFFFKHELLQKYRWYWRIEPDVKFHCNINRDPFVFMEENNKSYGFTITVYEISATIRSLWDHVKDFVKDHPGYIAENNSMGFISNDRGRTYNRCHFWSNFEIADMEFWRSRAYTEFFEYLDSRGGFYYERWGDAPIHSIAASLFLSRDRIHFFDEIGYQHDDWVHCPAERGTWEDGRCGCVRGGGVDYTPSSCKRRWDEFLGLG